MTPLTPYALYQLSSPHDRGVYVGISSNVAQRLHAHFHDRLTGNPGKEAWFRHIKRHQLEYRIIIIGIYPDKRSALSAETQRIAALKRDGSFTLHNLVLSAHDLPQRRSAEGRQRTGEINRARLSQLWQVVTPSGQILTVTNLKQFCREHQLDDSSMSKVANKQQSHHKGYRCSRLVSAG